MLLTLGGSIAVASAGFGFVIVLVGTLQFFMSTAELVGVVTTLNCVLMFLRVIETRKIGNWSLTTHLIIPSFFSIPLGVAVLKYLDPLLMRRFLNLVILVGAFTMAYSLYSNHRLLLKLRADRKRKINTHIAGFMSGFMIGSCSMGASPLVIWGILEDLRKIEMHAVWARFFFSAFLFSFINLNLNGLYNSPTVLLSFFLIPAVLVGFRIGIWIRNRISEERFRFFVLVFLSLSGLAGFAVSFK